MNDDNDTGRRHDEMLVALQFRLLEALDVMADVLRDRCQSGEYMSAAEASAASAVPQDQIDSLARHRLIRAIRAPAGWFVHRSALAYLASLRPRSSKL
jgi:hypothetical protein